MNRRGFSLIEILVVLTLAGSVGALLISIFIQNNGLFYTQTTKISQGLSLNEASSKVNESIKSAAGIVSSNSIGNPQYQTSENTLVLSLPAFDGTGNIIDAKFDYLIITKDPQNPSLLRKIIFKDPQSTRDEENTILANRLSVLKFIYLDAGGNIVAPTNATKVNYIINLEDTSGYGTHESSSSSEINLRNN